MYRHIYIYVFIRLIETRLKEESASIYELVFIYIVFSIYSKCPGEKDTT